MRQARQTGMSLTRRSSSRLSHVAILMVLLFAAVGCAQSPAQPSSLPKASVHGVPASRLARLARCVDITRWFWAVSDAMPKDATPKDATLAHFGTYMGDDDLALIHQLGFRCVRLSIEPDLLYRKATPQATDTVTLCYFDTAVKSLLSHDLTEVLDLHVDHPDKPY